MKQISIRQLEVLACSDGQLETEIKYAQAEWIQANARWIADVETKRADKTLYGEWPKGWRTEMIRASKESAKKSLMDRFLHRECKQLNGVIWLGNWEMIKELEAK